MKFGFDWSWGFLRRRALKILAIYEGCHKMPYNCCKSKSNRTIQLEILHALRHIAAPV